MSKMNFSKLSLFIFIFGMLIFSSVSSAAMPTVSVSVENQVTLNASSPFAFKLLSYNILEGGKNPEYKDVLVRENADVVMLVETGTFTATNEINALFPNETPYQSASFDADSVTDGQAVLSRFPIVAHDVYDKIPLDNGQMYNVNHALLHVALDIDSTIVHLFVVHFTCCGEGEPSRKLEMEGYLNIIDSFGDVPIIYAGDFNSLSPLDTGDIASNQEGLGDAPIAMLLNSSSVHGSENNTFVDVYRTLNPTTQGYTYVDTTYESRIDYIFVNQDLNNAIVNSTVVDNYPAAKLGSDHFAISAFMNMDWQTVDLRPPVAVHNIQGNISETSAAFSWDNNSEIDLAGYQIYRNNTLIADLNASTLNYVDATSYTSNTIYRYDFRAVDNSSNLSPNNVPVFVNTSYGILHKPSNITFDLIPNTVDGGLLITIHVGNNGGLPILYYHVYRSLSLTSDFIYRRTVSESNFTELLSSSVLLYYKIRAENALGISRFSEAESGKAYILPSTSTSSTHQSSNSENTPLLIFPGFIATIAIIQLKKRRI